MAKISQLPTGDVINGSEQIILTQGGDSVKLALSDFLFPLANALTPDGETAVLYLNNTTGSATFEIRDQQANGLLLTAQGGSDPEDSYIQFYNRIDDTVLGSNTDGGFYTDGMFNVNPEAGLIITTYTPTGNDDATGVTGSLAWDEDFMYVKTAAGWASSPLTLLDPTP